MAAFWLSLGLLVAASGASQAPASNESQTTTQSPADAASHKAITDASALIRAGQAADALPILDRAIADLDQRYANEKRQIYCARSTTEVLLYLALAAKMKKAAIALGPDWSTLIFLKGFALTDVGRGDEAKPLFDRAIAMSPMNSQFLSELAEWYRTRNDWKTAYAKFEAASADAEFSPENAKSFEKRRALRGMAFILSDEGKFDEAEALYQQCLKLDPTDDKAKHELEYIREQRLKAKSAT